MADTQLVLPLAAQSRLEKRRAEAELEFLQACQKLIEGGASDADSQIENLLVQYTHDVFFVFAEEAVNSVSNTWTVRKSLEAYLPAVIDRAFMRRHRAVGTIEQNTHRARFQAMARFILTNSPSWLELQKILMERADLETKHIESMQMADQPGGRGPTQSNSLSAADTVKSPDEGEAPTEELNRRAKLLSDYKRRHRETVE